jgi:AhpD family alkylhydroperoxidase
MTSTEAGHAHPMPTRIALDQLVPHVAKRMEAVDTAGEKISLDGALAELVRTRASQINGCAFCTDAHSSEALDNGVSSRKLLALPVWRESPFFSARERAALELTEAVTLMSEGRVTDELWAGVAKEFTEVELAELMWTIIIINVWNRVAGPGRPWPIEPLDQ